MMDEVRKDSKKKFRENIFTKSVKAGKRTYYFDVKESKKGEYYVTVTERKRRYKANGTYRVEKHKIFLYQEDFEGFADALDDIIEFVQTGKKPAESYDEPKDSADDFSEDDDLTAKVQDYTLDSFEDLED